MVPFNLHSPPHQRVCPLPSGIFKFSVASYVSFGSLFKNHPILLCFSHLLPYIYMYSPKIILIPLVSGHFSFLIPNLAYFYFFFFSTAKFLRKLLFFSKRNLGLVSLCYFVFIILLIIPLIFCSCHLACFDVSLLFFSCLLR